MDVAGDAGTLGPTSPCYLRRAMAGCPQAGHLSQ